MRAAHELLGVGDDLLAELVGVGGEARLPRRMPQQQRDAGRIFASDREQGAHRRVLTSAVTRGTLRREPVAHVLEHRPVQRLLRVEVAIHDQPRDAGGNRNVLHRGLGKAALGKGRRRRPQDRGPAGRAVEEHAGLAGHRRRVYTLLYTHAGGDPMSTPVSTQSAVDTAIENVTNAIEQDGWAIVPDAMNAEWVAEARADLTKILESTPFGRDDFEGRKTRRVYALFAKTRTFDAAATHPIVLGVLDRVLGNYQLSAPTGIEIGPGERAQPLHPDDAIYPLARPHDEIVMNAMWPLCDFTAENGGTVLVPGSHRWTNGDTRRRFTDDHRRDAGRFPPALPGKLVARRWRELHRSTAPWRRRALRVVVATARREPRARRPSRDGARPSGTPAGAPRLQRASAVHRLRRRPASAQSARALKRYGCANPPSAASTRLLT